MIEISGAFLKREQMEMERSDPFFYYGIELQSLSYIRKIIMKDCKEDCVERESDFFQWGVEFNDKKVYEQKKVYKQKCFSLS